jgi:hypothetical protein
MTSESSYPPDSEQLTIRLEPGSIPVSYLSSLLRVLQATLREVARTDEGTRREFGQRPQPILDLSSLTADSGLSIQVAFAKPGDTPPLRQLSTGIFEAFLDRFTDFVKGLPQPGLWGGAARRPPQRHFETELTRRMDGLYRELRRSPKATMRFQRRTVEIEGDRMEIL